MSYKFKKGATSQSIELYIVDSSDGTPETGVVFNTAGIDLKYRRKDAVAVSITEADLTTPALTDTWESGGFLEIGNGVYRLDLPDAALASASGIDRVVVFGTVTGMVVLPVTIHLTDIDLNDPVRAGLTALPNAAAEASGGLFTRGSGAGQINQNANGDIDVDLIKVSRDAAAADNLELGYDGTGLSGDKFPVRQDQLAAISGGLGISVAASAVTISANGGSETNSYTDTATHNDTLHIITDSGTGVGIEYYYTFNTGSLDNIPTNFHFHGWFQDGTGGPDKTCALQVYNWAAASFETVETLTHATAEEDHAVPLLVSHVSDGDVGAAGDVRIRFKISAQENASTVSIDHASLTYASFVSAADMVDEWEAQSQADPTGFHINQKEVNGTAQTANDNSADINAILDDTTGLNGAAMRGTNSAALASVLDGVKAVTDIIFGHETTISAVQTADTVFDMADGIPNIDDYNNMVVAIKDVSSGYWVVRKATDYDQNNLRITIDRDTGFPLAVGDLVKFSNLSYAPVVAGGAGATAQEVHEYDVSGISTPGQAGYEIQQRGSHLSR